MTKFKRFFDICGVSIKTSIARSLTYRLNFVMYSIMMLLSNFLFPLFTVLVYKNGASFPGWNFLEVIVMQAVLIMATAISNIFFGNLLWLTLSAVREGTFEIHLIKPINPLALLVSYSFNIDSVFLFIGGATILGISLHFLGTPSLVEWLSFFLLFVCGILVMGAFCLIMAATSFKWVGNSRLEELFSSVKMFGQYPQSIFPAGIRVLTSFIVPVAMIAFFPSSALLGRSTNTMFIAIIPCIAFTVLGIFLYIHEIHSYEGVGG